MLFRTCGRGLLTIGIILALNQLSAADDTRRLGPIPETKRLDLKASQADQDAIEEVCRKRRLFKRSYPSETYYLPPVTTYSAPPIEYSVPPNSVEPPFSPAQVEPPTLPMPASPTFRYDGGPMASPKPMPQRAPAAPVQPPGPALGPAPTDRMVSTPKPKAKLTFPAFGERRADDTVLLKGTRK